MLGNKPDPTLNLNNIRFTAKVVPTNNQSKEFEYPNQAMRDELVKLGTKDFWLSGFENNAEGKGGYFNFVFSNGKRTEQKDNQPVKDFMMPETIK